MINLGIKAVWLSTNGKFSWIEFATGHIGSIRDSGPRAGILGYYSLPTKSIEVAR